MGGGARVLVVGDVITDIICRPDGALNPGSDRRAQISMHGGGSGANQAVWLASFGLDVRFVARVGSSDVDRFTAQFRRLGIEPLLAGDPRLPSGTIVTLVAPDGERSFLTDRGANTALCADDLPPSILDGVDRLLISGYALFEPGPRLAVLGLMRRAREMGIGLSVDPASVSFLHEVGIAHFLSWTAGADLIFANEAEAAALTGENDNAGQVRALAAVYRRVALKCGAAGAMLGDRHGVRVALPAPSVAVVDSTGAGDAFAAAFVAAELSGCAEEVCLERAIAAGSAAVQQTGGRPRG